jgi:hypothetical protein
MEAMMTQHDRLCAGLEAMGAERLPKRNKYTMFKITKPSGDRFYFVGKAGALRFSIRHANAALSISCNDEFKRKVMNAPADILGI